MAFDEDNLGAGAHLGHALHDIFDIAGLIASRHDYAYHGLGAVRFAVGLAGASRATIKLVSARCRNGQSFTR